MNYNDIDIDIKLQVTDKGFSINDYLESKGVNPEHYIALLLLLPDDAQKRDDIHYFLEIFNMFLENGSHNSDRVNGDDYTFSVNNIHFHIAYQVINGDDEEIVEASLINTDLPEDAWKWLNYQCKVILTKWESFNF